MPLWGLRLPAAQLVVQLAGPDPVELEAVAAGVRRAPHRYVVDILDSHHEMTGVIRTNGPPFYPVNRGGGGGLPAHPGFLPRLQSLQGR